MLAIIEASKTTRVIWKCRRASCKHVFAHDYEDDKRTLADGTTRWITEDFMLGIACPICKCSSAKGHTVHGKVSDTTCGPRCLNATGPDCDCKCGGRMHGQNHL